MRTECVRSILAVGGRWLRVGLSGIVIAWAITAPRAEERAEAKKPEHHRAVGYAQSAAARDLEPALSAGKPRRSGDSRRIREIPLGIFPASESAVERAAGAFAPDAAVAPSALHAMPTPIVSFEGLNNDDNLGLFGFRVTPPDTNGDVGPAHYVHSVNIALRVYDKAGTPLTPAFKMSSLFGPLGGICAMRDDGDPIVLYDALADRWLISQFAFANPLSPPYHQCIAVSRTGDPTGGYHLYDFVMPGANLNDYPKFGVWPDAYYMTDNQFQNAGPFSGAGVFAFDRAKMLAGDPTAGFIYFDLFSFDPSIFGMLPSDFDGLNAPPPGSPNYFAVFTADEFAHPSDGLRIFEFHADFDTPANSTFTERPESPIAVAAFDPRNPPGRADIEQPPPGVNVDSIQDRLMHRLAYRNFGGHESLVVTHTVNVGPSPSTPSGHQAAIRYYELRRSGGGFSVHEQATFAPDSDNRWMGSAAMDHRGNLAVGYSVSSSTTFPSIRYAGRLATDPPGGLFQGEATLVAGSGVQRSTSSRWGDYSAMSVDPTDDCTFWYTNEYYTAASQATSLSGWVTRIGSFKFAECTPAAQGTLQGTVTDCDTNLPLEGALAQASSGFSQVTDPAGFYSRKLAPGVYSVTYSFGTYGPVTLTDVTIADGGTTTRDVCLAPSPILIPAGASLVTEGCAPANGVIDPFETVTVSLCVENVGSRDTVDLIATLASTGGVVDPNGPQSYGIVLAGGPPVCRDFSFEARGACGGSLVATLDLRDGAEDLGMTRYPFTLGVRTLVTAENFDAVTPPALPAGWVAVNALGLAPAWVTSSSGTPSPSADTAPNAAFIDNPAVISDKRLDSPPFVVPAAPAPLSFRHNYALEAGFDGGVLEISIGGGGFQDILAAGGSFLGRGYDATIPTAFGSPIAGRRAWSGNSGGFVTTTVALPAAAVGESVVLRWRMASDNSVAGAGWRVDTLSVPGPYQCCCETDADCDDGDVCTDDTCTTAGCVSANNTAPCDDGDACTVDDRCSGGSCAPGLPRDCDDGNVCTDDSCDPATGCASVNNTASCDDGNACTTSDRCAGGSCVGGPPPSCDDGNVCTDDSCDPATGCVHTNNTASCNDGDPCTLGDRCGGGVCQGSRDTQPPSVHITQPGYDQTGLPSLDIPINVAFTATDNVRVAREWVKLEGCTLRDGNVYGDRDGLLSDERIQINRSELCQAMARCGYTILYFPRIVVESRDACGNTGRASRIIRRNLIRTEVCR